MQLWDAIGDPIYDLPTFCAEYFVPNGDLYDADNWGNTSPNNSSYWYSNAGFTLLGFIVESVAEMPFNEYVQSHILQALEMPTAGWFYSTTNIDSLAMPYSGNIGNFTPYGYFSLPEYPAAMLKANVEELSNFLIAYTQHGAFQNTQLLTENTFQSIVPNSMTNGFGWWGTDTWYGDPTGDFWSHGGFMNGVRTQLNYYPSDSTGLIILTNGQGNYSAIQNKLEEYIPLFEVENPVNVVEENATIEVIISPNPAHDFLVIKGGINGRFYLSNMQGQVVLQNSLTTDNQPIRLSDLANGVYIFAFEREGQYVYQKVLVNCSP